MEQGKEKTSGQGRLRSAFLAAATIGAISMGAAGVSLDQAVDSFKTGHPVRAAFLAVSGAMSGAVALWTGGLLMLGVRNSENRMRIRRAIRPGKTDEPAQPSHNI